MNLEACWTLSDPTGFEGEPVLQASGTSADLTQKGGGQHVCWGAVWALGLGHPLLA